MRKKELFIIIIALLSIMFFVYLAFISYKNADKKYEQGYIDACKDFYQGKLKYDLVEKPDGTKVWEKVK